MYKYIDSILRAQSAMNSSRNGHVEVRARNVHAAVAFELLSESRPGIHAIEVSIIESGARGCRVYIGRENKMHVLI
jgi:hypothetical protein